VLEHIGPHRRCEIGRLAVAGNVFDHCIDVAVLPPRNVEQALPECVVDADRRYAAIMRMLCSFASFLALSRVFYPPPVQPYRPGFAITPKL
jgi:hypothetical protein